MRVIYTFPGRRPFDLKQKKGWLLKEDRGEATIRTANHRIITLPASYVRKEAA